MRYLPVIFTSLFLSFFAGVIVVYAVDPNYTPLAPLPGTFDVATGKTDLTTYLPGLIKLFIALGGALSVFMAIVGGTQYVAAGISPDAKSGAKERITNALIGLTLVLTSYLILNSISPNLVAFNFGLPPVGVAPGGAVAPTVVTGACPSPLTPLSGEAMSFENGTTVSYSSDDTNIQQNLTKLQAEVAKLQNALSTAYPMASMTVNSAYRPLSYQRHLWEIVNKWKTQNLENNNDPACASIKSEVSAEYAKHGLGSLVASPTQCAPHVKGTGVDIRILGGPGESGINSFLTTKGIDLNWRNLTGDPVHHDLKNPPYTPSGC